MDSQKETSVKDSPEGFKCECGGRLSVRRTVRLSQTITRERVCDDCGEIVSTVETLAGIHAERHVKQIIKAIQSNTIQLSR